MVNIYKNDKVYLILIILIIIIPIPILLFTPKQAGIINPYNPDEEGFWSCITDDIFLYGLYDDYKFESGYNKTYYALMKNEILSVDDQGIDPDIISDLLFQSNFLIGTEEIGISIPQLIDFNLLFPLISLISTGGDISSLELSSLPSFHFVNSQFLNYFDLLSNILFLDDDLPTFSFEYENPNNKYDGGNFWEVSSAMNNEINVVKLFGERNISQGLEFIMNNNSASSYNLMESIDYVPKNSSGEIRFYFYPDIIHDNPTYFIFLNQLTDVLKSNGIIFSVLQDELYFYEGNKTWFNNGLIETWIDNPKQGTWTKIGDLKHDWNQINIKFQNNLTKQIDVKINNNFYKANYSVEDPVYGFQIEKLIIGQSSNVTGSGGSKIYIDDLNFYFENIQQNMLLQIDIPIMDILRTFSIYSMFYFPQVFNFDAFYDLFKFLFRFIDRTVFNYTSINLFLESNFTSIVINEPNQFKIMINNSFIDNFLDLISDLTNFSVIGNIGFMEGNVTWVSETTWDKNNTCLNKTSLTINYNDLKCVRELGLKLIATRSPNVFQDGYWSYNASWYQGDYLKYLHPNARLFSYLDNDIYPSYIPNEWKAFDLDSLINDFIEEFDPQPIINRILSENKTTLILISTIFIGSSIGISYLIKGISYLIKRRK